MFSFLSKNPVKKLTKQYNDMLEQAMLAQRKGDIRSYSELTEKTEKIAQQISALENS